MAVRKKCVRGVQDIHTHSGALAETKLPHQAYLKIACLEMERFRRGQERQSAMHRVETIDARFREIGEEQAVLFQRLGQSRSPRPMAAPKAAPEQEAPRAARGFRIRY